MSETIDLTTETDKVEESLDGAEVIGPYRAQLLEYTPTNSNDEEFIEIDSRSNDWSDIALGLYNEISRDLPSDVGYDGGGIAGACVDPATGEIKYASSDPGSGASDIKQTGTTVKDVKTPTTTVATVPNIVATSSTPNNINELQKEIVNQAVDFLQKKAPGQKWEDNNVAVDGALTDLRKKFPSKSGMAPEMWCALFTTVVVNEACKIVGAKNTCPITLGASASVVGKNPPTDTNPEVGDIMFKTGGGRSGHVGIVVSVEGNTILTIEGNSGDAVVMRKYKIGGMKFKHAGRMQHTGKARNVNGYGKLSGLASAGYLNRGKWKTT